MRFLDANVLVYAYLKPRRRLTAEEERLKERAKAIVRRINGGERVVTSVVHLSDVANVLEGAMPIGALSELIRGILSSDSITVVGVSYHDYLMAADLASTHCIGINDSLALIKMRERGIREIYSFDRHFDEIEGIVRVFE